MSLTPNPSYLDDWKDLKEYTHQKHEESEKEKDSARAADRFAVVHSLTSFSLFPSKWLRNRTFH